MSGGDMQARAGLDAVPATLTVAVVHAGEDVVHFVAAGSEPAVVARLGEYVRSRAPHQLWPDAGSRVLDLLGRGRGREAVGLYFASVGERWDRECLHLTQVEVDLSEEAGAPA